MNPGIRQTVQFLNQNGFITTDSGDGETNPAEGMEGALEFPHVFMVVSPDDLVKETERLYALLANSGVMVQPMSDDPEIPAIEGSYDPCDDTAVIALFGVDDRLLFKVN